MDKKNITKTIKKMQKQMKKNPEEISELWMLY